MAITINALTTGVGGLETTADASGSFSFQSDGTTIATVTSSGFSVTGTFNAGNLQVGGSDVVVDTDIGSTVQAYDAGLTSIAGLTTAANKMIYATASDTYAVTDLTAAGRAILDDADAAAQRTTLGLGTAATTASTDYATAAQGTTADSALQPADIGSSVQAYDADLTAIGGLANTDGNFIVGNGTTWVAESGATARTSLGLGGLATLSSVNAATITDNSVGAAELDVTGNGTSGQYLASDGDGTMTWTNLPAASSFDAGTLMLFQQTNAPTGWTKQTTHNNKALRVVSGTASSGGSVAFTTAFASQSVAGTVSITGITGSAGATTLSTSQIPAHNHSLTLTPTFNGISNWPGEIYSSGYNTNSFAAVTKSDKIANTGGGGSHTHPFSFSSGTASFSGTAINLAVQYVDLIIASKD